MHVSSSSYDSIFELVTGEYLFDPKECSAGGRLVYEREEDLLAHHQVKYVSSSSYDVYPPPHMT